MPKIHRLMPQTLWALDELPKRGRNVLGHVRDAAVLIRPRRGRYYLANAKRSEVVVVHMYLPALGDDEGGHVGRGGIVEDARLASGVNAIESLADGLDNIGGGHAHGLPVVVAVEHEHFRAVPGGDGFADALEYEAGTNACVEGAYSVDDTVGRHYPLQYRFVHLGEHLVKLLGLLGREVKYPPAPKSGMQTVKNEA